jgi:hypothetical protein
MDLTGILFHRTGLHLAHHQTMAGWPWAAALLVRSKLLGRVGGPYFGSAQGCDPPLTPATKDIIVRIFGCALNVSLFCIFIIVSFRATMDFVDFLVLTSPGDRF